SQQQIEIARAEIGVVGALANPTVTVLTARQTAALGTTLALPLPVFGQRGAAVKASAADLQVAAAGREATRSEVRWSATLAWSDPGEARERARPRAGALEEADRLLGMARERFEAGSAPRLDVIRTGADQARARAESKSAAGLVAAAAARLAPWIGLEPWET